MYEQLYFMSNKHMTDMSIVIFTMFNETSIFNEIWGIYEMVKEFKENTRTR